MTFTFALLFSMLWAFNAFIGRRALYPPSVLCGMWTLTLLAIWISGATFIPIIEEALCVFLFGAWAFSLGAWWPMLLARQGEKIPRDPMAFKALDLCLFAVILGLPFFFQHARAIAEESGGLNFLFAVRLAAVTDAEASERGFSLLPNLALLSSFVAMAMHIENDWTKGRRWRSWVAIACAVAYGVLSGSKGFALLVLLLMFISLLRAGRASIFRIARSGGLFVILFGSGLVFINYAYMDETAMENLAQPIVSAIQNYWLSSSVAFGQIYEHPTAIASAQNPIRVVWETLNGFGANFEIPSIHVAYTDIGSGQNTNTYTIFFSYFIDYGWAGVFVAMFIFGALATWAYIKSGNQIAMSFAATFLLATMFTVHSDKFALGFNGYAKQLIFFWGIYYVAPPVLRALRAFKRLALAH